MAIPDTGWSVVENMCLVIDRASRGDMLVEPTEAFTATSQEQPGITGAIMLNFNIGLVIGLAIGLLTGGMLGVLLARLLYANHRTRTLKDRRSRRRVSFPLYCSDGIVALVDRRGPRYDRRLPRMAIKN